MTRVHDAHFTGLWVAQCAKREAWQTNGNVSFDVPIAQPSTSGSVQCGHDDPRNPMQSRDVAVSEADSRLTTGPLTHQRPSPADCRTDRPSPAVPSVAAVGAPLYALVHYCRAAGLPEPVPEYVFHPTRRWRFDFAFPLHKIAVEVDGGVWTQGRHTRGAGYIADMEKMNAAAKLGWRVLKYTPQTLGAAIDDLRVVLA